MAVNFDALYRQARADIAEQDRIAGKSETPMLDTLLQGWGAGIEQREYNRKEKYYKDLELDGVSTSLDSLILAIDNVGALDQAEHQIAAYEKDAGSNAEHRLNAMTLRTGANKKRKLMIDHGNALEEASKAIDRGEFSYKQADFMELGLPETFKNINAKLESEGLKTHDSLMDYLASEITRTERLIGNITPGMKKDERGKFRSIYQHGRKLNSSDAGIYEQLTKHSQNLEMAMKGLQGDNMITIDEATSMLVNPEFYDEQKTGASAESERLLGVGKSQYNWWTNAINKEKQGLWNITEDELDSLNISGADLQTLRAGNSAEKQKVMGQQRDKYMLDMQMQNDKHFNWTGRKLLNLPGISREEPDDGYADQFDDLQPGEAYVDEGGNLVSSDPRDVKPKVTDETIPKPSELSDEEYNALVEKTISDIPKKIIEQESEYKGMEADIKSARTNLFNSNLGVFNTTKKLSKLKSDKKAGYEVDNSEFKQAQDNLSEMKSNVDTYKKELKRLAEKRKTTFPPLTSVKFEKQVRERAMNILKEKGLKATEVNFKKAMRDARNSMRKAYPDIWGTQVKRGKQAVPYYMTGSRMPKP